MTVGQRLQQAREKLDMAQKSLAIDVGCDAAHISKIEHDERLPSMEMALKLERSLHLPQGALLTEVLATQMQGDDANVILAKPVIRALLERLGFTPDDLHRLPPEAWERLRKMISPIVSLELERYNHHGAARHPSTAKSVFIVEDEAKLVRVLTEVLQDRGFDVRSALNGRAALNALLSEQTKPDCIILDLRMPQMDGIAFLRKLRQVNTTSKVLVVTGHPEALVEMQGMRVEGYFEKPFSLPALVEKVEAIVSER